LIFVALWVACFGAQVISSISQRVYKEAVKVALQNPGHVEAVRQSYVQWGYWNWRSKADASLRDTGEKLNRTMMLTTSVRHAVICICSIAAPAFCRD